MHMTELQSFICKFHHLWEAGFTAHLNLDTHAGQAWVGLRVQLGQVPDPGHQQPGQPPPFHRRSPAYHRRQERRRSAKAAAGHIPIVAAETAVNGVETVEESPADKVENGIENCNDEVNNSTEQVDETMEENTAEKVEHDIENSHEDVNTSTEQVEGYICEICDFKSKWSNGLSIHSSRKHSKIEQLDGNDDGGTDEDREYDETINYWREGKISTIYQSFLDVNAITEESDLEEHEKKMEKEKVLEARKEAFGDDLYRYYPPWRSR